MMQKYTKVALYLIVGIILVKFFSNLVNDKSANFIKKSNDLDLIISDDTDNNIDFKPKNDIWAPKRILLSNELGWGKDIFYDRSKTYLNWFKLTGISKIDNDFKAFINNKVLSSGDVIKGFKVLLISSNQVILTNNKSKIKLDL
tara:strand:+ start:21 stop:452 length:432 start_codon:yes stop_codon:yes gene_type:complete